MECYTYLRNVADLLFDGKTPHERRFGQPFKGLIIPFGSLFEYYPTPAKDQSRIHQFGKKVFPGLFRKGDVLIADLEELETMDASGIYSKDSMRKRWYFPKQGEFIFPIADGRIKTPGGDQDLRTSTLIRPRPIRGEGHVDFLGESEGSLPQPHDSLPVAGEAMNDFWSMSGSFIYRHHVEPRVALYSPREESFPVPLKYIDVTRTTHTNLDVKQERRIDVYWYFDGSRDLSDSWTCFTQFTLLEEHFQTDMCGPGWDWRESSWHPGQIIYGQNSGRKKGKNAKLKERQKWSHEQPQLDSARRLRGIFFTELRTRNSKKPSRMLARNWKHQWLPLCLARSARTIRIVGMVINPLKTNQILRVFWKPVNLHVFVWENLYRIIVKIILQERRTIHYSTTVWFISLFLCLKQ